MGQWCNDHYSSTVDGWEGPAGRPSHGTQDTPTVHTTAWAPISRYVNERHARLHTLYILVVSGTIELNPGPPTEQGLVGSPHTPDTPPGIYWEAQEHQFCYMYTASTCCLDTDCWKDTQL